MENQTWHVEGNQHLSSGLRVNVRVTSGTDLIADVPQIENARLIAAAPALYEVVKMVLRHGYRHVSDRSRDDGDVLIGGKLSAALALVDKNGEL